MKLFKNLVAAAVLTSAAAAPAQAAMIRLDAKSTNPTFSDFSITYNDADADGLFSLTELTSFSGMRFEPFAGATVVYFVDTVDFVPTIANFTVGVQGLTSWSFSGVSGASGGQVSVGVTIDYFRYTETALTTDTRAVPEPGSMALATLALAAAGYTARRRRD